MLVLLTGAPSAFKSATARLLAQRIGFAYHPLHPPVDRPGDSARTEPGFRTHGFDALRRRLSRNRHMVVEDLAPRDDLRKLCENTRTSLFIVRLRDHETEVRRSVLTVPRGEELRPIFLSVARRTHDERQHRKGGEVDLEIQAGGKEPSEAVWWIVSSGQFVAAIGEEGLQITITDPPAEDGVLHENLVRNAGSPLAYECLYCNQYYLREHALRLDPVRYLLDGVFCMPWSCQWCWGNEMNGVSQDEALTQAEEAEQIATEAHDALRRGAAEEAVKLYLRASEFAPSFDGLYAGLGAAYAALGQREKALVEFSRAARLHPTSVLHRHARACLLEEAGDGTEAMREWNDVLRLSRRAQLAPSDFERRDLAAIVAEANFALTERFPGAAVAREAGGEHYTEVERAVLRAEDHYGKDEVQEALACLEIARELYVKESGEPPNPQLFQRINRLTGDCYQKLSGGGMATREGGRSRRPSGDGRAPRKSSKPRRGPGRSPDA